MKKLESDLKSAQASNLINAQSDFTFKNSGQLDDAQNTPQRLDGLNQRYDSASAEQQWKKLHQAQEIVTAKVQPLRVNLPVRGRHFAFTQVLQTEGGRPMTVQLFATSSKAVNWPARLGAGLLAFGIFWGMVAAVSRATRRQTEQN